MDEKDLSESAPEREIDFQKGLWGMWTDTFSQESLLRIINKTPLLIKVETSVFFLWFPVSLAALIDQLPKARKFLAFPVGVELDKSNWKINWVGHLGCFPVDDAKTKMLNAGHSPELVLVACMNELTREGQLLAVQVGENPRLPVMDCCW